MTRLGSSGNRGMPWVTSRIAERARIFFGARRLLLLRTGLGLLLAARREQAHLGISGIVEEAVIGRSLEALLRRVADDDDRHRGAAGELDEVVNLLLGHAHFLERDAARVEQLARIVAGVAVGSGVERYRRFLARLSQGVRFGAALGGARRDDAPLVHIFRTGRRRRVGDVQPALLVRPAIELLLRHHRARGQRENQGNPNALEDHAEIIPLCFSSASTRGSRPRNARDDSAAGRPPPTAAVSSRHVWAGGGASTPLSSKEVAARRQNNSPSL